VPDPDRGGVIEAAAAERIVAFAQPGKPLGIPVLVADRTRSVPGQHPGFSSNLNDFESPAR
jgi:hypothetical protein